MSNSPQQKRRRAERTRAFLDTLIERYPNCFSAHKSGVKPLAIGIEERIRQDITAARDIEQAPNWLIKQALARYTSTVAYLDAVIVGEERIDLDGQPAGEVTESAREYARNRRTEQKKRAAERRRERSRERDKQAQRDNAKQRKLDLLASRFNDD